MWENTWLGKNSKTFFYYSPTLSYYKVVLWKGCFFYILAIFGMTKKIAKCKSYMASGSLESKRGPTKQHNTTKSIQGTILFKNLYCVVHCIPFFFLFFHFFFHIFNILIQYNTIQYKTIFFKLNNTIQQNIFFLIFWFFWFLFSYI